MVRHIAVSRQHGTPVIGRGKDNPVVGQGKNPAIYFPVRVRPPVGLVCTGNRKQQNSIGVCFAETDCLQGSLSIKTQGAAAEKAPVSGVIGIGNTLQDQGGQPCEILP